MHFTMAALLLLAAPLHAAAPLDAGAIRADAELLVEALRELHPALTRYQSAGKVDALLNEFVNSVNRPMTQSDFFIDVSRLTASIRCGHTWTNFSNQSDAIVANVLDAHPSVPFHFRFLDGRMIVTASATEAIRPGDAITAIDGVPMRKVIARLLTIARGDGSNDARRLRELELRGEGAREPFDVYFPLLFSAPPHHHDVARARDDPSYPSPRRVAGGGPGRGAGVRGATTPLATHDRIYTLTRNATGHTIAAPSMTPKSRREALGIQPPDIDALWEFRMIQDVAYLRIGSFVTWRMKRDWKAFLDESIRAANAADAKRLILDIRGNEGGSDEPGDYLRKILGITERTEELEILRYEKVPERLNPHLKTWDKSFRDRSGKVKLISASPRALYTWIERRRAPDPETTSRFSGSVVLLVDETNSSATFRLARDFRQSRRGTLIGRTTGGNLRGTTGGQMFFLHLPNSGIEVDIPLIAYTPTSPQPDRGLEPDVVVPASLAEILGKADPILEKALVSGQWSGVGSQESGVSDQGYPGVGWVDEWKVQTSTHAKPEEPEFRICKCPS